MSNIDSFSCDTEKLIEKGKSLYNNNQYTEALSFFLEAAKSNDLAALQWCGCTYRKLKEYNKSVSYFLEAYKLYKDIFSALKLTRLYGEETFESYDIERAMKYGKIAAEGGNKMGMQWMGYFYEYGKGVEKDTAKAVEWYEKSLSGNDKDDEYALKRLGKLFYGDTEANEGYKKAIFYLEKAAPYDSTGEAMLIIGKCYYYGGRGIKMDDDLAAEWFAKAAKLGNAEAKKKLAKLRPDMIAEIEEVQSQGIKKGQKDDEVLTFEKTSDTEESEASDKNKEEDNNKDVDSIIEATESKNIHEEVNSVGNDKKTEEMHTEKIIETEEHSQVSNKNEEEKELEDDYITVMTLGALFSGKKTFIKAMKNVLKTGNSAEDGFIKNKFEIIEKAGKTGIEEPSDSEIFFKSKSINYKNICFDSVSDMEKYLNSGNDKPHAAILIVSAFEGVYLQTREQIKLAGAYGISDVVVYLNKCDLVSNIEIIQLNEMEIKMLLNDNGYNGDDTPIIKGSAIKALERPTGREGFNIFQVIQTIDKFVSDSISKKAASSEMKQEEDSDSYINTTIGIDPEGLYLKEVFDKLDKPHSFSSKK